MDNLNHMEQVGMKIKDEIIDIIETEVSKMKLQIPFDGMYNKAAEKIMELFDKDKQKEDE